ncbi:MAG: hypothetical protein AB2L14_14270 [Candidatus Xenobiia bacterium LiM19]
MKAKAKSHGKNYAPNMILIIPRQFTGYMIRKGIAASAEKKDRENWK